MKEENMSKMKKLKNKLICSEISERATTGTNLHWQTNLWALFIRGRKNHGTGTRTK